MSYQYNGDGLRMSATSATATTDSAWDNVSGASTPLNINDATTTSSGTTDTSYIYGDLLFGGTAPIEQLTTTSSGTSVSYLVSNQTGVQGVYSDNSGSLGAVQEMAIYSVYGIPTISSGTDVTPFGFQGSYTDPTGLIYLINRYYDPSTNQFLSIDPNIATTDQPYVFTNDDPLNSTDPLGDDAFSRWVACLVLAVAANCFAQFGANEPKGGPPPGAVSKQNIQNTLVPPAKIRTRPKSRKSTFWGDVGAVLLAPSRALRSVIGHLPSPPKLHSPHLGPIPLPFPDPIPFFG